LPIEIYSVSESKWRSIYSETLLFFNKRYTIGINTISNNKIFLVFLYFIN